MPWCSIRSWSWPKAIWNWFKPAIYRTCSNIGWKPYRMLHGTLMWRKHCQRFRIIYFRRVSARMNWALPAFRVRWCDFMPRHRTTHWMKWFSLNFWHFSKILSKMVSQFVTELLSLLNVSEWFLFLVKITTNFCTGCYKSSRKPTVCSSTCCNHRIVPQNAIRPIVASLQLLSSMPFTVKMKTSEWLWCSICRKLETIRNAATFWTECSHWWCHYLTAHSRRETSV